MTCRWLVLLAVTAAISKIASGQSAQVPPSPDRPWHFPTEREIQQEAWALRVSRLAVDPTKVYPLAELMDFAERNNPETPAACQGAQPPSPTFHISHTESYPPLAAFAPPPL